MGRGIPVTAAMPSVFPVSWKCAATRSRLRADSGLPLKLKCSVLSGLASNNSSGISRIALLERSACIKRVFLNNPLGVSDIPVLLRSSVNNCGNLVILDSWPGQARTLYGDHDRFVDTYFKTFRGMYFTGDGARRDEDGYYWITGRVDDVLNVSGHRMGTAEIESAMVAHPKVAEAAVVGVPHDIKGQGIYVYVTLKNGEEPTEQLRLELKNWVRKEIGPIASPDVIQWAPGLPKTRSGKIMRRILRKIATAEYDGLGDISTLADPGVVQHLIDTHKTMNVA